MASPRALRSLGIDVAVKKGLDLVLLEAGDHRPAAVLGRVPLEGVAPRVEDWKPDVVCVDGPPSWSKDGGSRQCERILRGLGIQSYGTPTDPGKSDFFSWMRISVRVFEVLESAGYPRYRRGTPRRTAVEVFPHATIVVLAGGLPPRDSGKQAWRASILRREGLDLGLLKGLDLIDAALAALTGLHALRGDFTPVGDPDEGVIVVPSRSLPAGPYRRLTQEPPRKAQLNLPGQSPCRCGDRACRETTSQEFAPGHDAKRKSMLWKKARDGEDAVAELARRGWELPPDLRSRR